MSQEKYFKLAFEKHNGIYDYTNSIYLAINKPITYVCKKHGPITQRADGHLKYGCMYCAIDNRRLSYKTFIKKAKLKHYGKYEYYKKNYLGTKFKVKIKCPIHGIFYQTGSDHLKGNGCRKCKRTNGENKISELLTKLSYEFEIEYKIKDFKFRYDFYIPSINLLIEYDGIQHFKPIEFFGGIEGYKKVKKVDEIKTYLAKKYKYRLLRISYKEIKHLESNLKEKINYIMRTYNFN